MKTKVSLALFLVVVLSLIPSILNYAYVASSKVRLFGYIKDSNSQKGIQGAKVYFYLLSGHDSYVTYSDSNGYYSLELYKDNSYGYSIEKEDYISIFGTMYFPKDSSDEVNHDFYMQRATYKLSIVSKFGSTQGSGYYISGTNVTFSVSPNYVQTEDTRASFVSWSSSNGYSGTKNPAFVIMPKSNVEELANWKVEYRVKVYDNFGNVLREDWVLNGSSYTISVDDCITFNNGTRLKFSYWSGGASGSQNPVTIVVSSPKVITAVYKRQYYLKLVTNYSSAVGEGWYDEGSSVSPSVRESLVYLSSNSRVVFKGWNCSSPLTIVKPTTLTAVWEQQYYIDARTKIGSVSGLGWYSKGSLATISLSATSLELSNLTKFLFFSWSNGEKNPTLSFTVNSPLSLEAIWKTYYLVEVVSRFPTLVNNEQNKSWVERESVVYIIAQSKVKNELNHYAFFNGFSGDVCSKSNEVSFIVEAPKKIFASWIEYSLKTGKEYWVKNGERASVSIAVSWLDDSSPASNVEVVCLEDGTKLTSSNGAVVFSFSGRDQKLTKSFVALSSNEYSSEKVSTSIIFTDLKLSLEVSGSEVGEEYWANSNSQIEVKLTATLTFNNSIVKEFSSKYIEGNAEGKEFKFSERDKVVEASFVAGFNGISSDVKKVRLVFTSVKLSAVKGGSLVKVVAQWAHDGSRVAGIKI
ncbi:MAG: InlB B-repeat-containing protein, partial [Thermoproteota archaeon]